MKKSKKNKRKGFDIPGMKHMRCPYCGNTVHLRSADGIYKENKNNAMLYVCSKYPECDAYVSVQSGTNIPLGSLANAKLRSLRITAHRQFNKLYESGLMPRKDAYNWLAYMINSPLSHAHIGHQSEYYCNIIIEESKKLYDSLSQTYKNKYRQATASGGGFYATQ